MKKMVCIVLFVFIANLVATQNLVVIDNLQLKEKYSLTIIEQIAEHYLTILNDNELNQIMNSRKYSCRLLDTDPYTKDYFLIYTMGSNAEKVIIDQSKFSPYGTILEAFDNCLLMQTTKERLDAIDEISFEAIRLTKEPLNYEIPKLNFNSHDPKPVIYRSVIEEMLKKVNKDSTDRILRDLCGFTNRDWKGTFFKDCRAYTIKKFKEYGCDSIFEVPIPSGTVPAIVGLKKGTKNPKKVIVIGAHEDTKVLSGGTTVRHQGANDNASGFVQVLESARIMKDYKFENSIMYCGFTGEEYGLFGSKAIVDYLQTNKWELVEAGLSFDCTGIYSTPYQIKYCTATGIPNAAAIGKKAEEITNKYKELINIAYKFAGQTGTSASSDAECFWKKNMNCLYGDVTGEYGVIHKVADSITSQYKIDHLAEVTKPGLAIAAEYAIPENSTNNLVGDAFSTKQTLPKISIEKNLRIIIITIQSTLDVSSVDIFNSLGQKIVSLPVDRINSHHFQAHWNLDATMTNISNGLYYAQVENRNGKMVTKMMISH